MDIVEIIQSLNIRGGAELFFANLCLQLARDGNRTTAICLFDDVDPSLRAFFETNQIPLLLCHKKRGLDLECSKTLRKQLNSINPEIVHMHMSCLPTYYFAFGFHKSNWKLVETFHSIPGKDVSLKSDFFRRLYIRKRLIHYVAISKQVLRVAKKRYPSVIASVIYNGVPISPQPTVSQKEFDFITVASFTEVKNHAFLIKGCSTIVKSFPKAKLIRVGAGPTLNHIRSLIQQLGIENNVVLTGQLDAPGVNEKLASSRVFVLPSTREGNPLSVLEAMAAGLPIIASKVGGLPDIVKQENGILFDVNDMEQFQHALLDALLRPELYERIGNSNVNYVKQFSMEECAAKYESLFCGLK